MEYRIEQLARTAGVAVDTIRFYQGKGLLGAPRRQGRVTWYGDAHVERLKRIKELQQQGFTLTVIQRFLAGELEASDEALVAAVTRPAAPQSLTLGELSERSGVAEPLLMTLQQAGLLVPIEGGEEPVYPADDLQAIEAGMKLISAGVPLGALMELGKGPAAAVGRRARAGLRHRVRSRRCRARKHGGRTAGLRAQHGWQPHPGRLAPVATHRPVDRRDRRRRLRVPHRPRAGGRLVRFPCSPVSYPRAGRRPQARADVRGRGRGRRGRSARAHLAGGARAPRSSPRRHARAPSPRL